MGLLMDCLQTPFLWNCNRAKIIDFIYGNSTLIQVMTWCRLVTSPYLKQSFVPNVVKRGNWLKSLKHSDLQLPMSIHWNENVVILTKFSSLAALEVVILTTSSAASDENFIKTTTFPFQCILLLANWQMYLCVTKVFCPGWRRTFHRVYHNYIIINFVPFCCNPQMLSMGAISSILWVTQVDNMVSSSSIGSSLNIPLAPEQNWTPEAENRL